MKERVPAVAVRLPVLLILTGPALADDLSISLSTLQNSAPTHEDDGHALERTHPTLADLPQHGTPAGHPDRSWMRPARGQRSRVDHSQRGTHLEACLRLL